MGIAHSTRGGYGLNTLNTSSIIHLVFPLTKESLSTNNGGGGNYGGRGTIMVVEAWRRLMNSVVMMVCAEYDVYCAASCKIFLNNLSKTLFFFFFYSLLRLNICRGSYMCTCVLMPCNLIDD